MVKSVIMPPIHLTPSHVMNVRIKVYHKFRIPYCYLQDIIVIRNNKIIKLNKLIKLIINWQYPKVAKISVLVSAQVAICDITRDLRLLR